jgi:hypothetical protein
VSAEEVLLLASVGRAVLGVLLAKHGLDGAVEQREQLDRRPRVEGAGHPAHAVGVDPRPQPSRLALARQSRLPVGVDLEPSLDALT